MSAVHSTGLRRLGAVTSAFVALVAAAPTAALATCASGTHLDEATITIRR
jgi:hypothetical protein